MVDSHQEDSLDDFSPETSPVASPCVRQCCLDEQNICLGCGRILEEICAWAGATAQRQQAIHQAAAVRRQSRSGTESPFARW